MLLFIFVLLLIAVYLFISCNDCDSEGFGQDASIRTSAGWVAGRGMYGYDPIMEFAQQIEEAKRYR